jgi:hypothetical protein
MATAVFATMLGCDSQGAGCVGYLTMKHEDLSYHHS